MKFVLTTFVAALGAAQGDKVTVTCSPDNVIETAMAYGFGDDNEITETCNTAACEANANCTPLHFAPDPAGGNHVAVSGVCFRVADRDISGLITCKNEGKDWSFKVYDSSTVCGGKKKEYKGKHGVCVDSAAAMTTGVLAAIFSVVAHHLM